MLHGKCSCGAVTFALDALPRDVHYCHCGQCRRATGGPFAVLVWCEDAKLSWFGEAPGEIRSSAKAARGFCGKCGSPLFMKYDESDETGIYVGAFNEPQAFIPTHHYGTESRLVWCDIAATLPGEECERKSLVKTLIELPRAVRAKAG